MLMVTWLFCCLCLMLLSQIDSVCQCAKWDLNLFNTPNKTKSKCGETTALMLFLQWFIPLESVTILCIQLFPLSFFFFLNVKHKVCTCIYKLNLCFNPATSVFCLRTASVESQNRLRNTQLQIFCGVFEGELMGQSLSNPDNTPGQTQQCVKSRKKSQIERVDRPFFLHKGQLETFKITNHLS